MPRRDDSLSARGGASSTIRCALVPPTPNELTPARRGCAPRGHATARSATLKGVASKSISVTEEIPGKGGDRARRRFQALTDLVTAQPAAARLCLIEAYAAGEEATKPLEEALANASISSRDVDRVFLTGGSSFVPAVRRIFERRFGADRVDAGNEFVSIANGLATIGLRDDVDTWIVQENAKQ